MNGAMLKLLLYLRKVFLIMCDNYRGISIMDCITKIYDYILCNRLSTWFIPDQEQADAQAKRSCMEHIVSLRLLIDFVICKRKKQFVVFVDFSKVYDQVPRAALIQS